MIAFEILFIIFAVNVMADDEIIIQTDYWNGTKCLENGVPWQVPGSIFKEAENCRKEDVVLELGSGGSTIFFARRCKKVIAVETDRFWAAEVKNKLKELNIVNVTLLYISNQKDIELFLDRLNKEDVNIFSVDTVHGYNRSEFVNSFFRNGVSDQLRMIIFDNYGARDLFPFHYNKEVIYSNEWEIYRYDDPRWCGNGTKLYIKKN